MTTLLHIFGRLRGDRGQAIILFVGIFTVIIAIGAITVDFGLWVSERRGAQKDADATSLAGVQAYIDDLTDTSGAFDDGAEWAIKNGVDPAAIDGVPASDCSAGNSCIQVGIGDCRENGTDTAMPWVEAKIRHESRSLFASIFGLGAPDIGAAARACLGSPRGARDLSPFGVQTASDPATGQPLSDCLEPNPNNPGQNRPVYGAVCILKTGAGDSVSGQRGALTLGNLACDQTSSNTLRHDFHYSAGATCLVGAEVNTRTGVLSGLLQGLRDRLAEEGLCDDLYFTGNAGYDDFSEVFSIAGENPNEPLILPSADNVFSENEACKITIDPDAEGHRHTYQPRAINLLLIDQFEQGQQTATIMGFAAFYVIGCVDDDDAEATRDAIELVLDDPDLMGAYMNRCEHPTGGDDILGVFVETLAPSLDVGDPDELLPLSIVLVK